MGNVNSVYLDSNKVRAFFFKSGLTKAELAQECGCTVGYINGNLNPNFCKKVKVSINHVIKLSRALNTTADNLIADGNTSGQRTETLGIHYAQIVQSWIDHTKISCNEVVRRSGVEVDALRRIRQGKTRNPRESTLTKLAGAFGVSYEQFIKGPEYKDPERVEAELIELPYEEEPVAETTEQVQNGEGFAQDAVSTLPEWLDNILKEEIQSAHKDYMVTLKAADRKCLASIVCMCAAFYQDIKKDR